MRFDNTYVIAEIAQAHDGSLGIAHSYIDAIAKTGVDAIKFQTHIAEAESSEFENFRVNFSYEDRTRFDYWKRMEFTIEEWIGLKKHCEEVNLDFISSPFSCAAVDILDKLKVKFFKIGSGELSNKLLIDRILHSNSPILLSTGMSSIAEIDETVNWISQKSSIDYAIFQCTTSYPTLPSEWGLNIIPELKRKFKVPIGFSDHSGDVFASLAAKCFGAELIEFHAVFSKEMFGPDSKASLNMDQIKQLVKGIKSYDESFRVDYNKNDINQFEGLKKMFGKSLCINKDLPKGHILKFDDLDSKKPEGYGINAKFYNTVIGRSLRHNMKSWDFINNNDLN